MYLQDDDDDDDNYDKDDYDDDATAMIRIVIFGIYMFLLMCNCASDHNDGLLPFHRLTNGWQLSLKSLR